MWSCFEFFSCSMTMTKFCWCTRRDFVLCSTKMMRCCIKSQTAPIGYSKPKTHFSHALHFVHRICTSNSYWHIEKLLNSFIIMELSPFCRIFRRISLRVIFLHIIIPYQLNGIEHLIRRCEKMRSFISNGRASARDAIYWKLSK